MKKFRVEVKRTVHINETIMAHDEEEARRFAREMRPPRLWELVDLVQSGDALLVFGQSVEVTDSWEVTE